jgi:hypothetical protein
VIEIVIAIIAAMITTADSACDCQQKNRSLAMIKSAMVLAATAWIMLSTAASAAEYYVIQEKSSQKCKVVETRPTETTWVQVGPLAFKTRDEADRQLKVICKERR